MLRRIVAWNKHITADVPVLIFMLSSSPDVQLLFLRFVSVRQTCYRSQYATSALRLKNVFAASWGNVKAN